MHLALAASGMLFTGWFGALILLRGVRGSAWHELGGVAWRWLLVASACLVAVSMLVQMAAVRARDEARSVDALAWTRAALVAAACFLLAQCVAWRVLLRDGVLPASGEGVAAFYLLAGVHALHLLVIGTWTWRTRRSPSGSLALAWHVLLVVWAGTLLLVR